MISEDEIQPGLVLHLNPDELQRLGGTFTGPQDKRVKSGHFFLCLKRTDDTGVWVPLFFNPGSGRQPVSSAGRSGHPKWTEGTFHWHEYQIWTAPHSGVIEAAEAGGDLSTPGARNSLAIEQLPDVDVR